MYHIKSIMYHYVRNPENTPFKGIHAVRQQDFIEQVDWLSQNCEMATLEMIVDFLNGKYHPVKDLCILTFDDGLKEHAAFVSEVLSERQIQGQFFIPTACIEEGYVLPVHKNHFLLATLPFETYKSQFLDILGNIAPQLDTEVDKNKVAATYRWDKPEVAAFKYLLNYHLPKMVRNKVLKEVFESTFGSEKSFAQSLYLNWAEARQMQSAGMALGGHSHKHNVLSSLSDEEQENEISTCMTLLRQHTNKQQYWPFSYPFGKPNTFNEKTIQLLQKENIAIAYTSEVGDSQNDQNPFRLKRIDPKDILINA